MSDGPFNLSVLIGQRCVLVPVGYSRLLACFLFEPMEEFFRVPGSDAVRSLPVPLSVSLSLLSQ